MKDILNTINHYVMSPIPKRIESGIIRIQNCSPITDLYDFNTDIRSSENKDTGINSKFQFTKYISVFTDTSQGSFRFKNRRTSYRNNNTLDNNCDLSDYHHFSETIKES